MGEVLLNDYDAPWNPMVQAGLFEPVEVHQAAGMVMAQLGDTGVDAIARLRGHAAVVDRPLIDVAQAVIARELCFSS